MDELLEKYKLMSISEASKAFQICREELEKCFHRGLKYKKIGSRKKVCFKWWIDYLEAETEYRTVTQRRTETKTSGAFKMDRATRNSIYSIR
jgi:hypothetical protein